MPIKLKNIPLVTEKYFDPLQDYLKNVLLPQEKIDYAERKLKAACEASDLIKKNTETPKKETTKPKKLDLLQLSESKDKLIVLKVATRSNSQLSPESQQTIKTYLSNLDEIRKENQLIYGKKFGKIRKKNEKKFLCLGLGLVKPKDQSQYPLFKKAFTTTLLSTFHKEQGTQTGAVEYGLTYDNKFFIVTNSDHSNNLYKMAQGTLLKALGCIQIGNIKVNENVDGIPCPKILEGQIEYISVYNAFFEAPQNNIAITLFALKKLGIDLSGTKVVIPNENALPINPISGCHITIPGEIQNAEYYLNETRFPGAKALAEKHLTFFDKLIELFCILDDEILIKQNKTLIEETYEEKQILKLNLIKLFNCIEEYINQTEKKTKEAKTAINSSELINQPSTSSQPIDNQTVEINTNTEKTTKSFNEYWQAIKKSIEFFREKDLDLNFMVHEINMILAYLLQNSLTIDEKNQLEELEKSTITAQKIPGRGMDIENISTYIKFYEQDPIKTCMVLLKDYSRGSGLTGAIYRFFSGAWNRNYKDSVNKFLSEYSINELPDNVTICDIYNKLKESGLLFNFDSENRSSLRKILLFCAMLNKEEEALLYLISNLSFTFFPPLDQSRQMECFNCC